MNIRHITFFILLFSVLLVLAEEDRTIRSVDIENPAEICSEDSLENYIIRPLITSLTVQDRNGD